MNGNHIDAVLRNTHSALQQRCVQYRVGKENTNEENPFDPHSIIRIFNVQIQLGYMNVRFGNVEAAVIVIVTSHKYHAHGGSVLINTQ